MAHYSIRTLEVGSDPHFPAGVAFDFWHMATDQVYSPFAMTLLQGKGHNILFDCGIDPASPFAAAKIAQEGDQNCHNPAEVLATVGLKPEDIDAIVISHCHWDHMNGLHFFSNATVYVQRKEYESWQSVLKNDQFPITHKIVVDAESMETLRGMVEAGKVVFLDGDQFDLFPSVHARCVSGHSFAQTVLLVEDENGHFALVGDVAMRPESFTGTEQFPCFLPNLKFAVGSIEDITASYRLIMSWVGGDVDRIVMTHDGTRLERSPSVETALGLHVSTINA